MHLDIWKLYFQRNITQTNHCEGECCRLVIACRHLEIVFSKKCATKTNPWEGERLETC